MNNKKEIEALELAKKLIDKQIEKLKGGGVTTMDGGGKPDTNEPPPNPPTGPQG